jgi:hypothetical protein
MISDAETEKHLAKVLGILQQRFDAGDKTALLMAIHQCLLMKKPLPEWLRRAFIWTYQSAARFEIRSWDEAFGAPHPKGVRLGKEREHVELRLSVVRRIIELHESGETIDKGLFERVGRELKIGGTLASELYYDEHGRELRELFES